MSKTMIQSLEEIIEEQTTRCAEQARNKLHSAVRPIFASKDGNKAEFIGSSMLLSVNGIKYIVTAAHLVDKWAESHSIFVGGTQGTKEQLQMFGKICTNDKLDFAFCQPSDEDAQKLGSVRFLDKLHISHNKVSSENRTYMAMGYPLSKNKKNIHITNRTIKTNLWCYWGSVEQETDLASKLKLEENDHFFLHFDKFASSSSDKHKVSTGRPTGISGGPLVDLGNFASIEGLNPDNCNGLICGIMTEWSKKHKVLIAVKIGHVIDAIRRMQDIS